MAVRRENGTSAVRKDGHTTAARQKNQATAAGQKDRTTDAGKNSPAMTVFLAILSVIWGIFKWIFVAFAALLRGLLRH